MKKLPLLGAVVCFLCLAHAQAFLASFTDEASFDSLGTIAHDSTFNDFGTGYGEPGNPFTRGGVTYDSAVNFTWGNATPYSSLSETLIGNDLWTPIEGQINAVAEYSMFGFYIGQAGTSLTSFYLITNLGAYSYLNEAVVDSREGQMQFRGWIAGAGEYFTDFRIETEEGSGSLAGITHVKVGKTTVLPDSRSEVPDTTTTVALLGFAAGLLAIATRKGRKQV